MKKIIKKNIYGMLSFLIMASCVLGGVFQQTTIHANTKDNTENLELNKTATHNDDGSISLELSAYAKGNVSVITKSKPSDIVLVLDTSGSMDDGVIADVKYVPVRTDYDPYDTTVYDGSADYYGFKDDAGNVIQLYKTKESEFIKFGDRDYFPVFVYKDQHGNKYVPANAEGKRLAEFGGKYIAKQFWKVNTIDYSGRLKKDILKESVKTFVEMAAKDNVGHRISIVSFASNAKINTRYLNVDTNKNELIKAVDGLQFEGNTCVNYGMREALDVINSDTMTNNPERNHSVILFTDGEPTGNTNPKLTKQQVADEAISISKSMKQKGFTVYSAGISSLLNNGFDPAELDAGKSLGFINVYMQYVSSNYPNATSVTNGGVGDYKAGKFLYATDEESFKKMFEKMREEITSTESTLDANTELRDYVTDYFDFINPSKIKVYTQEYLGSDQWGSLVEFKDANIIVDSKVKTVSVKGFSYKDNFVAKEKAGGKRLVVKFNVKPQEGFIGGNQINTNKEQSSIFYEDTPIKPFPQPKVNMPINYEAKNTESSIYITQNLKDLADIVDADKDVVGIQYLYKKDNVNKSFTLDGKNNAYVDILYTVIDDKNNIVGEGKTSAKGTTVEWSKTPEFKGLINNTKYTLKTAVVPTLEPASDFQWGAHKKELATTSTINVFKPILTVNNDYAFAGEEVNLENNIKKVIWKCADNTNAKIPKGDAPTLHYTFNSKGIAIEDGKKYSLKDTADFKIQTYIDNSDITKHTVISNTTKPNGADFTVRAIKGQIDITKNIDAPYSENTSLRSNQSFVFEITVKDPITKQVLETYYQTIDFDQKDVQNNIKSKTIKVKGLKKGIYEVNEVTSWSWKYKMMSSKTNYKSSTNTLFVGENMTSNQGNKQYFGVEENTMIDNQNIGNKGTVEITNALNASSNTIGDCANAINKFIK